MKLRIGKLKLLLLVAMSTFGTWASAMVLFIFNLLKQPLPFCTQAQPFFGIQIDCNAVLNSRYSQFFGIPLEIFAVAYFVVNLALVYLIAFGNDRFLVLSLDALFVWRFIGLMVVPYLLVIELVVLRAICIYCTIMHVAIISDFIIISYFFFYRRDGLFEVREPNEGPATP